MPESSKKTSASLRQSSGGQSGGTETSTLISDVSASLPSWEEEKKRLFLSKAESISFRQDPLCTCTLGSGGFWSSYIGYQNLALLYQKNECDSRKSQFFVNCFRKYLQIQS